MFEYYPAVSGLASLTTALSAGISAEISDCGCSIVTTATTILIYNDREIDAFIRVINQTQLTVSITSYGKTLVKFAVDLADQQSFNNMIESIKNCLSR